MKNCKIGKSHSAFTFVELLIVMTILAFIWAIWFYTLMWYLEWARDSSKITALNNIKTTLVGYKLKKWYYPIPTNYTNIVYSWATVWSQWTFWKDVIEKVNWSKEDILDPYTDNEYTYSVTWKWKEFQIAWALENIGEKTSYNNLLISSSFAAWKRVGKAVVLWDYNWNIITVNVLWTTNILSIPSIITSDLSSNNLVDIINNNLFVHDGGSNLPAGYSSSIFKTNAWEKFWSNNLIIFSWSLSGFKKEKNRLKLLLQLKRSYNWTVTESIWWRYLKNINIDLVHPSSRALGLACDIIQFELNYPIKCNNESFFSVPVINNTGLSNIDFSWLISQNVSSVFIDTTWVAWFGTDKWISKYSLWAWSQVTKTNWLVSNNIKTITQDWNGNIWVWTEDWISVSNWVSWTSYTKSSTSNKLVSNEIKAITKASNGDIWVTTDDWISVFNWTIWTPYTDVLVSKDVNKIIEVSGWDIWVATDDWISVFNWTTWNTYKNQLISTNVTTIIQVLGWDIWVWTDEWISIFNWSTWSSYENELIEKEVNDIFQDNTWKIWISTEKWVSVFDWTSWNEYAVSDWLISEEIKKIFQDTNNIMWFSTKKGLSELVNGKFINYSNSDDEDSDNNNDGVAWWVYVVYQSSWITVIWVKNN